MRVLLVILWLLTLGLVGASCGPIKNSMLYWDVEDKLAKAEKNDADRKVDSVEYYWKAKACLKKSKEKHGRSDYDEAEMYGNEAMKYADKALAKAKVCREYIVDPSSPDWKKKLSKKWKRKSRVIPVKQPDEAM